MDAVVLALCSAALFGGMTVAVRLGFAREGESFRWLDKETGWRRKVFNESYICWLQQR